MSATAGSDVLSQLDRFKESFLWAAAKGGRVEECESLVQMGTDVNWVSPEGDTPLLSACRNGHAPAALCLLSHGAEVNLAATDGQTALHLSCRQGMEMIAEALIHRGANVSVKDDGGATALESLGPHAPAGMVRRLNIVAQRRRHSNENAPTTDDDATTQIQDSSPISNTETVVRLMNGPRSGNKETRTGRRQTGYISSMDTLDGAGGVADRRGTSEGNVATGENGSPGIDDLLGTGHRSARIPTGTITSGYHGGRSDNTERSGNRTMFPSIAPVGSATTSRRSSPAETAPLRGGRGSVTSDRVASDAHLSTFEDGLHRRASSREQTNLRETDAASERSSNVGERDSSSEGFRSSDEDGDDDELFEARGTRGRLVSGLYRGSNRRPERLPPAHLRHEWNLQSMRLLAAEHPLRHVDAVAAAIALAAPSTPLGHSASTESLVSSHHAFDTTSPWDEMDPDEGGGHVGGGNSGGDGRAHASAASRRHTGVANTTTGHGSSPTAAGTTATAESTVGFASGGGLYQAGRSKGTGILAEDRAGGVRCGDFNFLAEEEAANDHVGLIRKLWLQEKESRLAAEAKADAVRDQSARLWNELVRSEKQVLSLEEVSADMKEERDKLRATLNGEGFKGRTLQELEKLEKELRKALEALCGERDRIVKEQLAKEEQRLCVVCQENEKGVLLLPCRHLCVCKSCSERRELRLCPLCRDGIEERLVVYS